MSELLEIQQTLKAPKGQFNGFGKYKYRSCEDILEALKAPLKASECYIVISDDIVLVGDRYYIKATVELKKDGKLLESASAFARESLTKKGADDSQVTGGASSYARKYALNGLFAIDDTKDADTDENKKEEPVADACISQKQFDELGFYCAGANGGWSPTGTAMLGAYNIGTIADLPASKFQEALERAKQHAHNQTKKVSK
tara:strand:- start:2 stop:604 length:603 start_codon:yes stop_codon:yes gene_type:complete